MSRPYFQFDDGQEIFLDLIAALGPASGDATKINVGIGGGIDDYTYTAKSANAAAIALAFINDAIQQGRTGKLTVPNQAGTALVGSNISPTTWSNATCPINVVVTGVGFTGTTLINIQPVGSPSPTPFGYQYYPSSVTDIEVDFTYQTDSFETLTTYDVVFFDNMNNIIVRFTAAITITA